MSFCRKLLLLGALSWHSLAHSEDLRQLYELARHQDPILQAAYASLKAHQQALPQAIAQMVPSLSANYNTTGTNDNLSYLGSYNTKNYGLTLTQPLFHPAHWAQVNQARHIAKSAAATYLGATQELIIRVATQYFNVLSANDDLVFASAQRKAFARELEQTDQRFEVGLIAITDVQEAKARHDKAVADEITAQNAVFDEYEKLREIVGQRINEVSLFPVSKNLSLMAPEPNIQENWVETSHQFNLAVLAAKENAEQQKAAVGIQAANHFPTVDLQGTLQRSKAAPPFPLDQLNFSRSISLNISVPLFAGGGVYFRTQEARARYEEALMRLESERRAADSNTRQAFRGVLTQISNVKALAQTVLSNKTALEATKAAYQVGTRTMVDVLDAESNLLNAQREHAKARYTYLLQGLKLKQAAGILTTDDLLAVNATITGKRYKVNEQGDAVKE